MRLNVRATHWISSSNMVFQLVALVVLRKDYKYNTIKITITIKYNI